MTRAEILEAASHAVTDRGAAYGKPEDVFGRIAAYWSAHLDCLITGTDVAVMMTLLKLARLNPNADHADSWVDIAGYAACGGEIATKGKT